MIRAVLYPFQILAALGLLASVTIHLRTFFGHGLTNGNMALFHIGIFVVFIPAILVAMKMTGGRWGWGWGWGKDFWKAALRGCPQWMKHMTYGFLGYALVNCAIFFLSFRTGGADGSFANPTVVRGFSGHWMAFYSASFSMIYSGRHVKSLERRCPAGHKVSPTAKYCEECGLQVPEDV
jgi:hypothetical protein